MKFLNKTRNQHFISQAEQRFNSINPNANHNNQRIYSFTVIDRENNLFKLDNKNGIKIQRNLLMQDLFSFDIEDKNNRYNFEELFQKYEDKLSLSIKSLLHKIDNHNYNLCDEIRDIVISKQVIDLRNPYCITKIINTYGHLANFHPTDPKLYQDYLQIIKGNRPQTERICNTLGITDEQYSAWLRICYMALVDLDNEKTSILDEIWRNITKEPKTIFYGMIFHYTKENCIMNDRNSCELVNKNETLLKLYNINSKTFLAFTLSTIDDLLKSNKKTKNICNKISENIRKSKPYHIFTSVHIDNLDMLERYNRNTAYQCYERIFCASQNCYGLDIFAP